MFCSRLLRSNDLGSVEFSYLLATDLVEKYLQDPNGLVEFRNIESSDHSCFALFDNGHSAGKNAATGAFLIPDSGVILSSGNPEDLNIQDSDSTTTDWSLNNGDKDLETAIPGADVLDPCYIQFEFRCPPSSDIFTPEVNFDYVFGSEEYGKLLFISSRFAQLSFVINLCFVRNSGVCLLPVQRCIWFLLEWREYCTSPWNKNTSEHQ